MTTELIMRVNVRTTTTTTKSHSLTVLLPHPVHIQSTIRSNLRTTTIALTPVVYVSPTTAAVAHWRIYQGTQEQNTSTV